MSNPDDTRRLDADNDENIVFIDLDADAGNVPTPVELGDDESTAIALASAPPQGAPSSAEATRITTRRIAPATAPMPTNHYEPTVRVPSQQGYEPTVPYEPTARYEHESTAGQASTPRNEPVVAQTKSKGGKGWILWTCAAVLVAGGAIAAVYYLLGSGADVPTKPVDPEQTIEADVPGATAGATTQVDAYGEVSLYGYGNALDAATRNQ